MDVDKIDKIFEMYGYDKVPFRDLPKPLQGYICAAQHIECDMIPSLISDLKAQANSDLLVLNKLKVEIAEWVLNELAAHIRTMQKDMIISTVDEMNNNGTNNREA